MRLDPTGERGTPESHEDPRPAVEGLERRRVDDPGPAGDRFQPPAPLAVETGARDPHPEPRLGPGLQAFDAGAVTEKAETRVGRTSGRGSRPRRRRGPEPELGEQDRRPRRGVE